MLQAAVLADDFSGATEMAGVASRFGLRVVLQTNVPHGQPEKCDVLVLDTDSRMMTDEAAADRVREFANGLKQLNPPAIYKKTDSVLRGQIAAEIGTLLVVFELPGCLFIPANPSRQRVIRDGHYFVEGKPLAEIDAFANDPTHPANTNAVAELLRDESGRIQIPNIESEDEIRRQAAAKPADHLAAGAADFFAAWLAEVTGQNTPVQAGTISFSPQKTLWVCGSHAAWPDRKREFAEHGIPVQLIDQSPRFGETEPVLALGTGDETHPDPAALLESIAESVAKLIEENAADFLLLEGGGTARAVIDHFGWTDFSVLAEIAPGTVAVRSGHSPVLLVKPGSYPWPERVWQFFE
ncbi:MAG: hypothetical protein HKN23_15115 [Verrucomicrobiales bacterium]|nr:hypothetical protein [Verrucomicrobiales bacterium]